ncbi:MAG TPA: hypothetical protein VKB24_11075 [Candidatus Acidoferrum sp.]|nr:hypothetical protein [Candidatus Acidoferrum sp.]
MNETSFVPPRRRFLQYIGMASSLACTGSLLAAQKRQKFPSPPASSDPVHNSTVSDPQMLHRAQLKLNEKEFRESLTNLYDRVSELKQDIETTHTADVFSMKIYKQTGEIEHLAKKLRSLVKI